MSNPAVNVSKLFDALRARYGIKSDAAFAEALGMLPPAVSKARSRNELGASLIVRICERWDLPVKEVRELAA